MKNQWFDDVRMVVVVLFLLFRVDDRGVLVKNSQLAG
jgi:hypothetical protein